VHDDDRTDESSTAACAAERFLVGGRLRAAPRRRADRDLVLEHLAARVLGPGEEASEPEVTARVAALADDPLRLRRDLVEAGLIGRREDGVLYWRERRTAHDGEPGARPPVEGPWLV